MSGAPDNLTHWDYWACPLGSPPEHFGRYASIVAHWQRSRRELSGLPPRAVFDVTDLRGWLGRVAIARIEHHPFDVRFSLWGTRLVEWWGVDYTNRRLGEAARDPDLWRRTEGRYFATMARMPFIGIAAGRLDQHDRSYKKVMSLDLPLGEGRTLTHVLALHQEIDLSSTPADLLPECGMEWVDLSMIDVE